MRSHFSPFLVTNVLLVILWFPTSTSANAIETVQEIPENPVAMSDESVAGGVGDGPGARPDVPPPNLVDAECYEGCLDGEVFNAIRNGVPPDYYMEPWEGRITDEDIWNIVNYLNSLKE